MGCNFAETESDLRLDYKRKTPCHTFRGYGVTIYQFNNSQKILESILESNEPIDEKIINVDNFLNFLVNRYFVTM